MTYQKYPQATGQQKSFLAHPFLQPIIFLQLSRYLLPSLAQLSRLEPTVLQRNWHLCYKHFTFYKQLVNSFTRTLCTARWIFPHILACMVGNRVLFLAFLAKLVCSFLGYRDLVVRHYGYGQAYLVDTEQGSKISRTSEEKIGFEEKTKNVIKMAKRHQDSTFTKDRCLNTLQF